MGLSTRRRPTRLFVFGLVLGIAALVAPASTALAASPNYNVTFLGATTSFAQCPTGTPQGVVCYTGAGAGNYTAPVVGPGTESDRGFLDEAHPNAQGCIPDIGISTQTATTGPGTIYLAYSGLVCGLGTATVSESGNWIALGGTGIFSDAHGSGTYTATNIMVTAAGGTSDTHFQGNISTGR